MLTRSLLTLAAYTISIAALRYDAIIGNEYMPRTCDEIAVGYDNNTKTILLFGGSPDHRQFIQFNGTFIDKGSQYLSQKQRVSGIAQHYMSYNNELWIIQETGTGFTVVDLHTYAVRTPNISIPYNVYKSGCLILTNNYIFIIGSEYSSNHQVQVYNFLTQQWLDDSNIPNLNQPRTRSACSVLSNKLYVFGGRDGQNNIQLNSIETLDISNMEQLSYQSWHTLSTTLSRAVDGLKAVNYGNNIVIIGGELSDESMTTDINVFNTVSQHCEVKGHLAVPISHAACILVNDMIYIFGGWYYDSILDDWYEEDIYQYIILDPTSQPTVNPTINPTVNPTIYPTMAPVAKELFFESMLFIIIIIATFIVIGLIICGVFCWHRKSKFGNEKNTDLDCNEHNIVKHMELVEHKQNGMDVTENIAKQDDESKQLYGTIVTAQGNDEPNMMKQDSEQLYAENIESNDDDLYSAPIATTATDEHTTNESTEGEGVNKYQRIENVFKSIDDDWEQYLFNFKKQKMDDSTIFASNFKQTFDKEHKIWDLLVPEYGVRFKLFNIIYDELNDKTKSN